MAMEAFGHDKNNSSFGCYLIFNKAWHGVGEVAGQAEVVAESPLTMATTLEPKVRRWVRIMAKALETPKSR